MARTFLPISPSLPHTEWIIFETHWIPEHSTLLGFYYHSKHCFSGLPAVLQGPGQGPVSSLYYFSESLPCTWVLTSIYAKDSQTFFSGPDGGNQTLIHSCLLAPILMAPCSFSAGLETWLPPNSCQPGIFFTVSHGPQPSQPFLRFLTGVRQRGHRCGTLPSQVNLLCPWLSNHPNKNSPYSSPGIQNLPHDSPAGPYLC